MASANCCYNLPHYTEAHYYSVHLSMSRSLPKNVNLIIEQAHDELRGLLDQLNKIQTLNNTLQAKLNATLANHVRVVNLRNSTLVLAVDSPAWTHKVRFMLPELLSYFRQNGYPGLANIDLIVSPRKSFTTD